MSCTTYVFGLVATITGCLMALGLLWLAGRVEQWKQRRKTLRRLAASKGQE